MSSFVVCLHDVTPAHASETERMLHELAPLVGKNLSLGVVPDWHAQWPLTCHRDFCRFIHDSASELLLHGFHHRRTQGRGITSFLAERSDEMNGVAAIDVPALIDNGQQVFQDVFGHPASGFLAPAWQRGHVDLRAISSSRIEYIMGYFSIQAATRGCVRLATFTWDCGRWAWLGHVGDAIGSVLHAFDDRTPVLALHPRDLHRGYWPRVLRLVKQLLDQGFTPANVSRVLQSRNVEVTV